MSRIIQLRQTLVVLGKQLFPFITNNLFSRPPFAYVNQLCFGRSLLSSSSLVTICSASVSFSLERRRCDRRKSSLKSPSPLRSQLSGGSWIGGWRFGACPLSEYRSKSPAGDFSFDDHNKQPADHNKRPARSQQVTRPITTSDPPITTKHTRSHQTTRFCVGIRRLLLSFRCNNIIE